MDDTLVIYLVKQIAGGGDGTHLALILIGIILTYLIVQVLKNKLTYNINGKYSVLLTIVTALIVSLLLVPLSSLRSFLLSYLVIVVGSNYVHTIYAHFIRQGKSKEEVTGGGKSENE